MARRKRLIEMSDYKICWKLSTLQKTVFSYKLIIAQLIRKFYSLLCRESGGSLTQTLGTLRPEQLNVSDKTLKDIQLFQNRSWSRCLRETDVSRLYSRDVCTINNWYGFCLKTSNR
jgi:hypothetical protein